MIALDTNVLVRLLVQDDELQYRRADRLVHAAVERGEPVLITDIVVCETVWTLGSRYKVTRAGVCAVVEMLLLASGVEFEDRKQIETVLSRFRKGKGDFADYLISEKAQRRGARSVATFDRVLLKDDGFFSP